MNATAAAALSGAIAFTSTIFLVPPIRRICIRWRLYDSPGALKIHSVPIPRLGGIAIAIAIAAASFSFTSLATISAWSFFVALGVIWITGLIDDLRGLAPAIRIAAQIASAAMLWRAGWRLPIVGASAMGFLALCTFMVIFVNSFNFLDGSDGLAASVAGTIALSYTLLPNATGTAFGHSVAWCLLGACAGFLFANAPPANIFMGDSGSTTLGFVIAFLALDFFRDNSPKAPAIFFPILIAALPLLDAALAMLRRLQSHSSPTTGDRRHFYDLLLARGWSSKKVLLSCVGITAGLGLVGWLTLHCAFAHAALLAAASTVMLLIWMVSLGSLRASDENPPAEAVQPQLDRRT